MARRVAVVGGGWAGLAAAVQLVTGGSHVTLFEMGPQVGGRARRVQAGGRVYDNGQHLLIGAYAATQALMRRVGVDPSAVMQRLPLSLCFPDGSGLRLPPGPAISAFVRGVIACKTWTWQERLALLRAATAWGLARFRCDPSLTVAALCDRLPARVRVDLIDPLCVAALNTPADEASASVFLRVLGDALFSGPGAADLLLPRLALDALLPAPAARWLEHHGAHVRLGHRVKQARTEAGRWTIDDEFFDAVVLACTAAEAARLTAELAPAWSATAAALRYEPIVTVYLHCDGACLPAPMVALHADHEAAPAQFAIDHGLLGGEAGRLALVISGAAPWVEQGRDAIAKATLAQAREAFSAFRWARALEVTQVLAERRATFRCTPALARPTACVAAGLWAAGDYVQGPYPATLEGAVRAGISAANSIADA